MLKCLKFYLKHLFSEQFMTYLSITSAKYMYATHLLNK